MPTPANSPAKAIRAALLALKRTLQEHDLINEVDHLEARLDGLGDIDAQRHLTIWLQESMPTVAGHLVIQDEAASPAIGLTAYASGGQPLLQLRVEI